MAIGSSDGTVRIFDGFEREVKLLQDKSVKSVPVLSLDLIRTSPTQIFVVAGHQKGQLALYELKGIREEESSSVGFKHHKTVGDVHA